ncbi:glycine betaine ABC transporter substrate-binding protein [Saccharospirillum salsuginis]|uniref:Glycine/betaine ABC transporter n=1 Tax=Saccharospirillum salsuginis TaxID=418750 RepID=A0A918KIL6_9GAMM|nr:glycine betaine ABC transporter substrate-binding protein [Saccharospirillum salsuginis]GGX62546.1 glycine/betaine ABC transporter [Saccharospirillum salsuginis]
MICKPNTAFRQVLKTLVATAAMTASLAFTQASAESNEPDVAIGWTTWGDAEVVSKMAAIILQQGMGKDVELTLADISVQYRGVADGDLDAMLMSWQPLTHKSYMERYADTLVDLGPLYEGADLGLVVPNYVPESELKSIADLAKPSVREQLGGQIQGIGANSGIMGMTQTAMADYGLDYEILTGTGPKMAMEIGKAFDENRWIVATGWHPHWKFAKYDLRYLDDPKGVYGGAESVHAIVHKGFEQRQPEIVAFLRRMNLSVSEVEELMAQARETSHRDAIYAWIENNTDRVQYWMTGEE